jgi:predicted Zn-dependent protease
MAIDRHLHVRHWCVALLAFSTALAGPVLAAKTASEEAELKRKADPWLANIDDVALRKNEADIRDLIDHYVDSNHLAAAAPYLERMLRANPRAYRYQLVYGQILAKQGQPEELFRRARQAAQYAEDGAVIESARSLAGLASLAASPALGYSNDEAAELVLVALDGIPPAWLDELREACRPSFKSGWRWPRLTSRHLRPIAQPSCRWSQVIGNACWR